MLNKILSKIQADLKVPKGQFNNFGKYNYRSCEDIVEAVKPLLHAEDIALLLSDEVVQVGNRIYVKATATITKGETSLSVTAYAREAEERKGMDDSQITGTASSYARKYALNGLFAIDDTKDADTDEHTEGRKKEEAKPEKKQDKKDEIPEFTPEPPLTFDELRNKILEAKAIPHLKNVWVKYAEDIKLLSADETKRLTAVKDEKKKELTGGVKDE